MKVCSEIDGKKENPRFYKHEVRERIATSEMPTNVLQSKRHVIQN